MGLVLITPLGEAVDRGAAVQAFQPSVDSERSPARSSRLGSSFDGVFEVARDEGAAPAEFSCGGNVGEGLDGALQERCERGEAGLAVLILREVVVGLEELEPAAGFDLLASTRPEDVVVEGKEITRSRVVRSNVSSCSGDGAKRRWRRLSRR